MILYIRYQRCIMKQVVDRFPWCEAFSVRLHVLKYYLKLVIMPLITLACNFYYDVIPIIVQELEMLLEDVLPKERNSS